MNMNPDDRWLLPEGIEEALPQQARRLELSRREIIDMYQHWGYELVMPPFIEYLESLLTGTGQDLDLHTFKLTDQLTGRMMGVRADMTPQVARIDAHRLAGDKPSRLCYLGTVLKTRPEGFAGSRSPLQIGAELYGHNGVEADLEIVSLLLETLHTAGVGPVLLNLGHVGILNALADAADLSDGGKHEFFEMLQRKAVADVAVWLQTRSLSNELADALSALAMLCGGVSVLGEAAELLAGFGAAVACIDRLKQLAEMLTRDYPQVSLHFDLGELRGYHYETGVVFAAYVEGEGQEIARGGRYDGIGKAFGRDRAAVGFSADLKLLMRLSGSEYPDAARRIYASAEVDADVVRTLREQGDVVVRALSGQADEPGVMQCAFQLNHHNGQWVVESI